METLWYCLVALILTGYVVLDGFDLGAGITQLFIARNADERRLILRTIGPVWDGNEVWLVAAGGTLFFAFPALYASSFSGFYLALMMVLWLVMFRGIAIEFRSLVDSPTWTPLWDRVFAIASALLAIFFGAALGNVVRGLPLDQNGEFFLPLWTDFRTGTQPGILDWYTISVALFAFVTLALHGSLWVSLKTDGDLQARARKFASQSLLAAAAANAVVTLATFRIQPQVAASFAARPWGAMFPSLAVAGLGGVWIYLRRSDDLKAFVASCSFITGMLASAAFGIFPYVLPSNNDPAMGLTVYSAAAPANGLSIGLAWWIPGMLLALGYTAYVYRSFAGKVRLDEGGH